MEEEFDKNDFIPTDMLGDPDGYGAPYFNEEDHSYEQNI